MAPRTPDPAADPSPSATGGITMLGAAETGKTTFLAALQIALLRQDGLGWSLDGDNQASRQAMLDFMEIMTRKHAFPMATGAQLENYRWSLRGDLHTVREWHWRGVRRTPQSVRIPLDLVDAPGEAANSSKVYTSELTQNFVDSLAQSGAIVLFFDPLTEAEEGTAFQYMYGVLTELRSLHGKHGKLPHYVAVCITKFDAIPVYLSAQKLGIVSYDAEDPGFPYVSEDDAPELLRRLIKRSRSDDASLILPLLHQTFHPDRIRYFATSAIGFYLDPSAGRFDNTDYQNHIGGKPDRIRGGIYPINVVEPVLWLGRSLARTAR